MHVLVTGGAGFIGSHFVDHLLENTPHHVTTLDTLTYAGRKANLDDALDHPRHRFVKGDVRDNTLVNAQLETADVVVNFAAETHVDRSIESTERFVSTNVQGTETLLRSTLETDLEWFVQVSTDEVYGETVKGSFSEADSLAPRNPYAATKASADLLAQSYHETHGSPVVIVRPSNNYGPRQHEEKLIPKFITRAMAVESLPVYGDGEHVREWTYVKDTCRAIETVIASGTAGEVYNVGSGVERRNIDLTRTIVDEVGGSRDRIEFVEDRPGHDRRYALDTTKIESLGWSPAWTFEEGLRETIDYYE